MQEHSNHICVVIAAFLSLLGLFIYVFNQNEIKTPVFAAVYLVGIGFWASFGFSIGSVAVFISSILQVLILIYFLFIKRKYES